MSARVQQRHLTWSDFNERPAAPSPASAALLAFFEIRFARKVPGGLVNQEAHFVAASTRVHEGRAAFSLPIARGMSTQYFALGQQSRHSAPPHGPPTNHIRPPRGPHIAHARTPTLPCLTGCVHDGRAMAQPLPPGGSSVVGLGHLCPPCESNGRMAS
jgi:hypothetical protein